MHTVPLTFYKNNVNIFRHFHFPTGCKFRIHYSFETANISENTKWGRSRGNKTAASIQNFQKSALFSVY